MFENVICVTDRKVCVVPFLEQIEKVCALKPKALILREKDLSEEEYLNLAKEVLPICQKQGVKFVAHTFWQAALVLGVSCIHLPLPLLQNMGAEEKSRLSCIGSSVHSVDEALAAVKMGAGFLVTGHIYASSCKPGAAPRGLGFLREVCAAVNVPVYAIGGIGLNDVQFKEIQACGASGACLRSALMQL